LLLQVERDWQVGAHGDEGAAPVEHWPGVGVPTWPTESHWQHPQCMSHLSFNGTQSCHCCS